MLGCSVGPFVRPLVAGWLALPVAWSVAVYRPGWWRLVNMVRGPFAGPGEGPFRAYQVDLDMAAIDRTVDWDAVAAIRSSSSRRKVFEALAEKPCCASEIANEVELSRAAVSQHIRWLKRREPALVECLTPERSHHRLYSVTREGESVAENL